MEFNNNGFRTVEILKNDEWTKSEFKDIKNNDTFRLYESDGTIVKDSRGDSTFIAGSDAYMVDELYQVWITHKYEGETIKNT